MNLYIVTCDNNEPWAEDNDHYTMTCRAATAQQAEEDALRERQCSDKWTAEAELLIEGIDVLYYKAELFDEVVKALAFERDSLLMQKNPRWLQLESILERATKVIT